MESDHMLSNIVYSIYLWEEGRESSPEAAAEIEWRTPYRVAVPKSVGEE